jgi:hypothetical protein
MYCGHGERSRYRLKGGSKGAVTGPVKIKDLIKDLAGRTWLASFEKSPGDAGAFLQCITGQ